jgi:hypothetical protein
MRERNRTGEMIGRGKCRVIVLNWQVQTGSSHSSSTDADTDCDQPWHIIPAYTIIHHYMAPQPAKSVLEPFFKKNIE